MNEPETRTGLRRVRWRTWGATLLLPVALAACGSKGDDKAQATAEEKTEHGEHKLAELSIDEVEQRLAKNDGDFFVYDCNQKAVFDSGHVPGAKFLDYTNLKDGDLVPNKDATLVFYCANEH